MQLKPPPERTPMRIRFWIGLAAVLVIAAGSVAAALIVHADDSADFHHMQRDEAVRAAHQAEAVAALSVGQLASAAAFVQAEGNLSSHEFDVIGHSLLGQGALAATAFISRVPDSERARFEREHGIQITERRPLGGLRRATERPVYFPVTYVASRRGPGRLLGYDLGSDPERGPFLLRARDSGQPVATPVIPLVLGGSGINVYHPVYRDGAPIATPTERRQALLGFAAGSFQVGDLAAAAVEALPGATAVQLRAGRKSVVGPRGELDDAATAPVRIADRTWLLVVRDPNRPDVSLPLLLGVVGISLAALLGSFILVWSRNERMQELERQAGQDSLTGLKNRRRFEEDLLATMARSRRDRSNGALLMLDLDHFKRVNDTHGHPAGDRVIKEIATVLRRRTRESDTLARLGGDEFAVVLPRCSRAEARVVAEAIAGAIRDHRPDSGIEPITVSVGVAMFGEDPRTSASTVVSEADTAMYAAKDGGRDGVRVFDHASIREDAPEAS
jgi:diguanylate cyclase (GGDEF)-like protein